MNKMNTIKKLMLAAAVAAVGLCGTAWAQEAAGQKIQRQDFEAREKFAVNWIAVCEEDYDHAVIAHTCTITLPAEAQLGDGEVWVWARYEHRTNHPDYPENMTLWNTLNAAIGGDVGAVNISQVTNGADCAQFETSSSSPFFFEESGSLEGFRGMLLVARVRVADGAILSIGGAQDFAKNDGGVSEFANEMYGTGKVSVAYYAWDASAKDVVLQPAVEATLLTEGTTELEDGQWYFAPGHLSSYSAVTVKGSAHLIVGKMADVYFDGKVTIQEGGSLSIYGASKPTHDQDSRAGSVDFRVRDRTKEDTDRNPEVGAGVTLNLHGPLVSFYSKLGLRCGTINVYGGLAEFEVATTYSEGDPVDPAVYVETALNVYGGWVKAIAEGTGAGIAGAEGCAVNVQGGSVQAYGGEGAAGISAANLVVDSGLTDWVAAGKTAAKSKAEDYKTTREQYVWIYPYSEKATIQEFEAKMNGSVLTVTMPGVPGDGYRWGILKMSKETARAVLMERLVPGNKELASFFLDAFAQDIQKGVMLAGAESFEFLAEIIPAYSGYAGVDPEYEFEYVNTASFELDPSKADAVLICKVTEDAKHGICSMGGSTHLADLLEGQSQGNIIEDGTSVSYYAWDEAQKKLVPRTCTDYTVVTPETATFEDGRWYVVNGAVENTTGGIVVNGSAHLILCDEAKLVVTGAENKAGIRVPEGNSIRIYGQAEGTGLLEATGGAGASGIGSGYYSSCGTIVIDGGTIFATGKGLGAGIGGGGKVQVVTINGGTVTATGEADGAGIGGAGNSLVTFGTITINGGVVTAVAQGWGNPGIGTGYRSYEGVVRINGGEITAVSKRYAVGGTDGSDLAKIEFGSEKTVAVLAGDAAPGGFVPASDYAKSHDQHYVHIEFGKTVLWAREHPGLQMVVSNDTEEVSLAYYNGVYSYMADLGESFQVYLGLKPYYEWAKTPVSNPVAIESIQENVCINTRIPEVVQTPIEYLEWDRALTKLVTKTCDHYTLVTPETSEFKGGWYVVVDDVVREGAVEVRGTADNPTCLIVCDDKKLTVRGAGQRGIFVGQGKVFSVFGQQMSTGELDVKGHAWGAGIGGHGNNAAGSDCGTVNINGGIITAQSGAQGVSEAIGRGGELKSCTTEAVTLSEGFKWQVSVGKNGHDEQTVSAEEYMLDHHWYYARLVAKPTTFVTAQPFNVTSQRDNGYFMLIPPLDAELAADECWVAMGLPNWTTHDIRDVETGETYAQAFIDEVYDLVAGEEPVVAGSRSVASLAEFARGYGWYATFVGNDPYEFSSSDMDAIALLKCRRSNTGDLMVLTAGIRCDLQAMANGEAQPNELSTAVRTTYYAWNDETRRIEGPFFARAMPLFDGTTTLRDGRWYVALRGMDKFETLTVAGDAHLILEDGCEVELQPRYNGKGIMPGLRLLTPTSPEDLTFSSISIYGQKEGTGKLSARGDAGAAGIGTGPDAFGQTTINIHGGQVTAYGGKDGAAAIGTGVNCRGFFYDDLSLPSTLAVNVYGGTVTANAEPNVGGPGIGFGNGSANPKVALTVLGGDVTCTCGHGVQAYAIGWGRDCNMRWSDPYDCDYLRFTLGRGMGLWAGKGSGEGEFGRISPVAYDKMIRDHWYLPYARIMPAPPLSVDIASPDWRLFTYEVFTNGAPMEVVGRGDLHLDLPGVTEVEVVFTVADGYQIENKQTWTKFIGVREQEGESAFRVEPPSPTSNPVISRQNFEIVRNADSSFTLKLSADDFSPLVDDQRWIVITDAASATELFDGIWSEAEPMIGTRRTDEVAIGSWAAKVKAQGGTIQCIDASASALQLDQTVGNMMVFKVTRSAEVGTIMTIGGERNLQAMTAGGDEVRTGSLDAEYVKPLLNAEVCGSRTDEYNEYGYPIYDRLLELKNETQPDGEVYFWVAYRRLDGSVLDDGNIEFVRKHREEFARFAPGLIDRPVGGLEQSLGGSVYSLFQKAEEEYYAATGKVASLGEFPAMLPRDTEEVFVFRTRPGANGEKDAKVVAIGNCADIGYDDGRWVNRLAGATLTISYFAWDEAAGKVVEQPPVEATVLPVPEDGSDLVLHGNRWYVVVGNRNTGSSCLRVDVGTAHLILADGASLDARGGVTVDADATLAVYSEKETSHDQDRYKQSRMNITASDGWAGRRDEPDVFGGSLEIHGGAIECYGNNAATIRNKRLAFYGGSIWMEGCEVGGSVISSRAIDLRGGYFDAVARYNYTSKFGNYPLNVIAGEQDGFRCELNVGLGAFVNLRQDGIDELAGSSALGDALDVNLADGMYVWTGGRRSEMQLSSLPIYRVRPKKYLVFNPSMEKLREQDFEITAVYDDSLKTNGFMLTLPAEELRAGEKWCVVGFDESVTRMTADEFGGVSVGEAMMLELAVIVSVQAPIVGEEAFARSIMENGIEGFKGCFAALTGESTIAIPADKGVDLVLVAKVIDSLDLPLVTLGAAKELQSMADGETKGCGLEFLQKQEFSLDRNADGSFTMTMPEGDVLKPGESWAWAALPVGVGDEDEVIEMFKARFGAGLPAGVITFDMFMEEEGSDEILACGSTTEQTFTLPAGAAGVLVGRTRPGLSMEYGPSEYLALSFGMASHLNVLGYKDWPRHDELFPNADDYCKLTLVENDLAVLIVAVDGTELGYRPDGVYMVRKGSEVRVRVLLVDSENYELRSPSMLVYEDIQGDVTVGPQQVVVVPKTAPTPVADQGFVVRRGDDGALTVDMSGEEPLGLGEMWVCMTIDKGGSDLPSLDGDTGSFGDIIWRDGMGVIADVNAGDLPLDLFLVVPGAEGVVVSTNETFAIPSDSEMALVARAYDGYNGKVGGNRYYGLSLGGVRFLTALRPGEAVEGERWNSEHKVRYSAWDGEKVVHGLVTNALPLTAASFDANGVLKVTSSCFYAVTGKVRGESARLSIDVAPGATLSLLVKDGAKLELGCINLPSTATLNVYGQDNGSGVMTFPSIPLGMAAIGGSPNEGGCGTINFHGPQLTAGSLYTTQGTGALQASVKGKIDSYAVIGGSLSSVAESGGALNVYRGVVDVMGRGNCAIGGYKPMQVNVRGGKVVVRDGAIGGMDLDNRVSGITLGAGYKLQCEVEEETVEMTVAEYDKLLTDGNPPNGVRIVRPAAVTFDAEIAKLVADGKLTMMVRPMGGLKGGLKKVDPVWTEEGGTYPVDCGDSLYVIALVNGTESVRRPDVMTFGSVTGDVAVTLADLNWHEPELVAEQKFEAYRCLDGRVRLTPKGRLAEGEAWLWIALPDYVAKKSAGGGLTIAQAFAQQLKGAVDSKACYVGGVRAAGGTPVAEPMLRPLYNCVQGNTFLPTDGFHWGVSREKSVFYAPADTDFAVLCKVYDAGIAQMMFASNKQSAPAEAAEAAAEAAQAEAQPALKAVAASAAQLAASGINVNKDLFLTVGCRYTAETAGSAMNLQQLPRLPEYEPGDVHNPWPLGPEGAEEPVAYTNDTETLVIEGKGPFAEPTKKPWMEEGVGPITEIVIKNPETELPDDIFAGLGTPEPVSVDLPDGWPADDLPVPGQPWHGGYVKIEEGHWPLTVSNVKFQQRYPWNGLVDITFDLTGSTNVELGVWAKSGATTVAASNFVGRTDMVFAVEGKETVKLVWDAEKDLLAGGLTRRILENTTITVGTGLPGSGEGIVLFDSTPIVGPGGMSSQQSLMHPYMFRPGAVELEPGDEIVVDVDYTPGDNTRCYVALYEDDPNAFARVLGLPRPNFGAYVASNGDLTAGRCELRFPVTSRVMSAFELGRLLLDWGADFSGAMRLGSVDSVDIAKIRVVKPGAVGGDVIGAESATGVIDLAKGTRVARDLEGIAVDPAWGAAAKASVLWPKAETAREYDAATVEQWDTARLPAGKYEFAYSAGETDYTAAFWVPADRWTVIDHETITGERPVTGEKVLVTGENVIKEGGKLIIAGEPEIIWDGTFRVEKGGKIYAPYFDVVVDPETGLVTLEPKARPTVTGLRFSQRYPWNGLVDVYFTATYAADPAAKVWVKLAAKLNGEEKQVKTLYLANDPATTNTQFQVAQGEVHLVWDTMKDVGLENFGALEITAQAALIRMAEEGSDEPEEDSKILCLTAHGGTVAVGLSSGLLGTPYSFTPNLEYSKDGLNWTKFDIERTKAIVLEAGESVYLRGNNPNGWNPPDLQARAKSYDGMKPTGAAMVFNLVDMTGGATVEASGSVMSLIDGKGEATEIPDEYCFTCLFGENEILTKAPDLTATTLKFRCYEYMFSRTSVNRIRVLAADDLDLLMGAISGLINELKGGTLVLNPCWKGVDFSEILPPSWQIVFDGEEQGEFLTFTNMNKSSDEIGLMYDGELMPKAWPVIEYSFDAQKWMSLEINSRIEVPMGGRIYFRGKNPKGLSASDSAYFRFASKGKYAVSGDVMSLIDYETKVTEIPCEFCFAHLFENMSITTAPTLSATTLKDRCYYKMFSGATSLTTGPALPAEYIPDQAYFEMFYGCTSLTGVSFGGNKRADRGMDGWLANVSSSGTITIIGNGDSSIIPHADWGIPTGWAIVQSAKPLPDKSEAK